MQPHDIYFVLGVFLPMIGFIGILNASAEEYPAKASYLIFITGLVLLGIAWLKNADSLTFKGFIDSALRVFVAITGV